MRQIQVRQVLEKVFSFRSFFIFLLLIILTIIFTCLTGGSFIKSDNLQTMFRLAPELIIVALGMALLLISGEFDLSVGSQLAFTSMVAAWTFQYWNWHPVFGLLVALIIGALFGFINGIFVTKTGVSSLIVTLGTMWAYRGLLLIITGGYPIYYHPENVSPLFYQIFVGNIGVIPIQIIWALGFTILLYILLEHTKFGNWVLSTGSNKEAAKMMGINVDRVKIICFTILGVLTAFTGVMQSCRIHGAYGVQGTELNLPAIAAAVIGGTSIYGGVGTIPGAFIGALIVKFIDSGLLMVGLSMFHFYVVLGLILIIVVFINVWLRKRKFPI